MGVTEGRPLTVIVVRGTGLGVFMGDPKPGRLGEFMRPARPGDDMPFLPGLDMSDRAEVGLCVSCAALMLGYLVVRAPGVTPALVTLRTVDGATGVFIRDGKRPEVEFAGVTRPLDIAGVIRPLEEAGVIRPLEETLDAEGVTRP